MYKIRRTSILILFVTFKIINATGNSRTVRPGSATKEDIDSLISISYKQALPVVLFKVNEPGLIRFAVGLKQAEIKDGRLVYGTEFYTIARPPTTQIFYCPNPEMANTCLARKNFQESQTLECDHEQMPVMVENSNIFGNYCGPGRSGVQLNFVHKMCPAEGPSSKIESEDIQIYALCYNKSSNRIIFTIHLINSVNLLTENLLIREREIEFERSKETYVLIDPEYFTILDAAAAEFESQYQFQMLVPSENMAFATWRKSINHYSNIALQHKKLFDLWNKINTHIRIHATEDTHEHYKYPYYTSPRSIMTGVFDIPDDDNLIIPHEKENQIPNIWITVVTDYLLEPPYKGLAILMNNFITQETETNQTNETSTSKKKKHYINRICGTNLCVDALTEQFTQIGGQIRCCELFDEIMKLFIENESMIIPMDEVLQIRGITYV